VFAEFADAFFFAAVVVVVAPGAVPQLRLFVGRAAVTQAGAQLRLSVVVGGEAGAQLRLFVGRAAVAQAGAQLRLFVGRAAVAQAGTQLRFFESRITFIGGARYSMHPRLVPGLAELSNTIIVACAASLHLEFLGCACGMAVLVVLEASPQHLGAGA
jgi:hypothetical protein